MGLQPQIGQVSLLYSSCCFFKKLFMLVYFKLIATKVANYSGS
nr:MAG TPA: hypothetical protein [Caudoviricetes sp.]DAS82086.1 MAG TPA: hypothetical protein [Caudoviricetes sp.]